LNRQRILIVGATGRVGGEVLRLIDPERAAVRVLVRNAAGVKSLPGGVEACLGDLSDTSILDKALSGVTNVFVAIRDCSEQAGLEGNLIDAARTRGVERFVKVSAFAAGLIPPPGYGRVHAEIEQRLRESGMSWTILRPFAYMQNFMDVADAIKGPGLIPFPLGRARVAFVDARDVARAAQTILTKERHDNETLILTGPDSLSMPDCAATFSTLLGRRLRYLPVPQWLANLMMRRAGIGGWDIRMRAELFGMLRDNGEATPTDTVERITGMPSTTLERFVADHREQFT
jgi:uncharacterized protein YbjT (DUF2867 family)